MIWGIRGFINYIKKYETGKPGCLSKYGPSTPPAAMLWRAGVILRSPLKASADDGWKAGGQANQP